MPLIPIILFGALSGCFALILELAAFSLYAAFGSAPFSFSPIIIGSGISSSAFLAIAGIALVEEASKYLFLRQYALRYLGEAVIPERSALILGTLFGIGFASLEIALAIGSETAANPLYPILGVAGIHIATSLAFAWYLFRFSPKRPAHALNLVSAMVSLHILYNAAILLLF